MSSTTPTDPWTLPELTRARRAIVVVDVVESVRLMQEDEAGFIDRWRRFVHEVRTEVLPKHGGRMVKSLGDGMLLEFVDTRQAVQAALLLHRLAASPINSRPAATSLRLRVAVHCSEVTIDDIDIYGEGVNLCARLSAIAGPEQTVVSAEARDELVDGLDAEIEDLGECFLKHLELSVRCYIVKPIGDELVAQHIMSSAALIWPTIAVVPFECTDGNDAAHIHGEACTDEVVARLVRVPQLHVVSTMSTRALRARAMQAQAICGHLGATYVIAGRYRLASDRLELFFELTDGRNGALVWADRLGHSLRSPRDAWAHIGATVTEQVLAALLKNELDRTAGQSLHTIEAYSLFFAAMSLMHRATARDFERARAMLEELAWRHNRSAVGHAWLAKWHVLRVVQGWSQDPATEGVKALDCTRRALDANSNDALALAICGLVHGYLRKDLAAAGTHYDAARQANPNEPLAWLFTATWRSYRDEGADAEQAADMALRLSPLDPMKYFFNSLAATAVLSNGSHARAIELAQHSLRVNRTHASTWRTLALAQSLAGSMDEARSTVAQLRQIEPKLTASTFLERYPGRDARHAPRYAQALIDAGLPA